MTGLLETQASSRGHEVVLTPCLTKGCRFDWLQRHLDDLGRDQDGLLVGVDGKKLTVSEKRATLRGGIREPSAEMPILWAVALPSIEAWMMADAASVPAALQATYGVSCRAVGPPSAPKAEAKAKEALSRWIEDLVGERFLRGGREIAGEVGAAVRTEHVARARHPELATFLTRELPEFLDACGARMGGS